MRLQTIARKWGIPVATLRRWRKWWQEAFPATEPWGAKRGELVMPSEEAPLLFVLRQMQGERFGDPVKALRRKLRTDVGRERSMSAGLIAALLDQYRAHPSWSAQLHYENLQALVDGESELGPMPSYATLTRAMRARGLVRKRRRKWSESEDKPPAEAREVLSYEVSRSHALWHADFHHGKRRVLTASGEWETPILLGFLDDHSRLGCHLQWYLEETAEVFVHGLCQAFMKRGLPRSLLTDNGSPMTAGEVEEGLHRLGILGSPTAPSPDSAPESGNIRSGIIKSPASGFGSDPPEGRAMSCWRTPAGGRGGSLLVRCR